MEANHIHARRRRNPGRLPRNEQAINTGTRKDHAHVLRRWQRLLAKIEREAGHYRESEVEMLIGTAILAIEDAIEDGAASSNQQAS